MKVPFARPSVDSIMSAFTNTISKLEKAAQFHADNAQNLQNARDELLVEQQASEAEAARAVVLANKLKKLVG